MLVELLNRNVQMLVLLLETHAGRSWRWSQSAMDKSTDVVRDAAITVWTHETLRDEEGRPLVPEVRIQWITFRRNLYEADVLARLQDAVRSLNIVNSPMRVAAATLLQSASSSSFALEQRFAAFVNEGMNSFMASVVVWRQKTMRKNSG